MMNLRVVRQSFCIKTYEKKQSLDVIIFPAGFTHVHRGNPPIGGTKYIATTWAVVQDNGGRE